MKTTLNARLLAYLSSGRNRTTAQIAAKLNVTPSSVTRRVTDLRRQGNPIYTNTVKRNGQSATAYRLGAANRQIVGAGFVALSLAKTNPDVRAALVANKISLRTAK